MIGKIASISIAPERGRPRTSVESALLLPNWGIEGDAHGGPGDRQLALFAQEAKKRVRSDVTPGLCYPRFRENIAVAGFDPGALAAGSRLSIGDAKLVVTSTQKKCYPECSILRSDCEIQGHVAFCRVEVGGTITKDSDISTI